MYTPFRCIACSVHNEIENCMQFVEENNYILNNKLNLQYFFFGNLASLEWFEKQQKKFKCFLIFRLLAQNQFLSLNWTFLNEKKT